MKLINIIGFLQKTFFVVLLLSNSSSLVADTAKEKEETSKALINEYKIELKKQCSELGKGSQLNDITNSASPLETVIKGMNAGEKDELAGVVNGLVNDLAMGTLLSEADMFWSLRVLSSIEKDDSEKISDLINQTYNRSVDSVKTIEHLNQLERLCRVLHNKKGLSGVKNAGSFDRSNVKKKLTRRRIALMRGRKRIR
jgi:hypothetical protein